VVKRAPKARDQREQYKTDVEETPAEKYYRKSKAQDPQRGRAKTKGDQLQVLAVVIGSPPDERGRDERRDAVQCGEDPDEGKGHVIGIQKDWVNGRKEIVRAVIQEMTDGGSDETSHLVAPELLQERSLRNKH
jgi:hypothetical protein